MLLRMGHVDSRAENGDPIVTAGKPEKAVTPVQIAALYDGDRRLGCGIIKSTSRWTPAQIIGWSTTTSMMA